MSDHENHDGHDHAGAHAVGGHEVDKMPSSKLFNLLFGLSALTLLASIGVVQLFYRQVDSIRDVRDTKLSFQLAEYRQEMDELKNAWNVVEMTDDDGVPETEGGKSVHDTRSYRMPLAEARKRVLEQPQQLLKAQRPYKGWRNPDANAPKVAPGPQGRSPTRVPTRPQPGSLGQPRGVVPPGAPMGVAPPGVPLGVAPPGIVQPPGAVPTRPQPVERKAPAEAPAKAPAKAPAEAPAKGGDAKAPPEPDGNE